jgi:hypothetical protein
MTYANYNYLKKKHFIGYDMTKEKFKFKTVIFSQELYKVLKIFFYTLM